MIRVINPTACFLARLILAISLLLAVAAITASCATTQPEPQPIDDDRPKMIHTPMGSMTVEEWEAFLKSYQETQGNLPPGC